MKTDSMFYVLPENSTGVLRRPEMSEIDYSLHRSPRVICTIEHNILQDQPSPIPDEIIFNGVRFVKKSDD